MPQNFFPSQTTRVRLLLALFFWMFSFTAMAQTSAFLYAGLVKSKGYVVGSKLAASGLHRYDGDQTWTHVGWNIPRVSALAVDPKNPEVMFIACGNGAARSRDGGKTWRMTTDWRVTETQDLCVDPNAPQHVYVATAYGIWATKDGGETWAESNAGLPKKYTQSVEVDRAQAQRVFAGTEGGLYLSSDGARTWSLVGPKDVTILDLEQSASAPQVWIAATQDRGVLLSNDNGQSWQFAQGRLAQASIYAVGIDPFAPQHLCAVGWDTGVFITTDGGKTWRQKTAGLPVRSFYETTFDANQAGRLWVATLEEGIFYSEDFGGTWHDAGMHGALVFDMVFINRK